MGSPPKNCSHLRFCCFWPRGHRCVSTHSSSQACAALTGVRRQGGQHAHTNFLSQHVEELRCLHGLHVQRGAIPREDGKKLLGDIAAALKNASTKKKLVGGSMNAEIGKSFIDVLTEIQKFVSANRRELSATELAEAMTFYGRIAVGMINFIGLLEADLKLNEALAKNFTSAGNSFVAMKALSMPSDVKTNIKTRLTTLAGLNKPIAAAMAKSINSAL